MCAKRRLQTVKLHLERKELPSSPLSSAGRWVSSDQQSAKREWCQNGCPSVEIAAPPAGCQSYYSVLMTPDAVSLVADLVTQFDHRVDEMLRRRSHRKLDLDASNGLPDFLPETANIRNGTWKVRSVPDRLLCRHIDLGDVSPADTQHFVNALKSTAQGIQADFDDGHCPSWSNQLKGLYNVYRAVHGHFPGLASIEHLLVLMMRPRAWNMVEHNMLVNGKEVPGPLFDFGLLMFHNARLLVNTGSGPFFYLSKLEGYLEARLWNDIFVWTQEKMGLPVGTVKACVLIENILATFQMEEILYELRDHSLGLNCGIWDYAASFVSKFGLRPEFTLPDRTLYVNMQRHFLKSYMDLVVKVCHRRGAHATGGMAASILPSDQHLQQDILHRTLRAKQSEIEAGVDGFLLYDLNMIQPMQQMFWRLTAGSQNQLLKRRDGVTVVANDLLSMPSGGVTEEGLKHNIAVAILFIYNWFQGKGHFHLRGAVEDSATAEISRSQVWQWIRHGTCLENTGTKITRALVQQHVRDFLQARLQDLPTGITAMEKQHHLESAAQIFTDIIQKRDFPPFITTYLNEDSSFSKCLRQ